MSERGLLGAQDGGASQPLPVTLVEIFASSVAAHPGALALEAPAGTWSYRELAGAVAEVADTLSRRGIGPGDRVGVHVSSGTAELYIAILAVLHCGACVVPLDAEDPAERVESMWRASGVCAVVGDGLTVAERAPATARGGRVGADDDAWIIFTSGTSGTPKAVAVTHRAAVAFVEAETSLWTVTSNDRVLAGLSVAFDASFEEMWLAWRHGAALVPAPRHAVRSGADFGPWLRAAGITVVSTVPTLASMWGPEVASAVRLLILGGEACPEELGWRLAASCEVWNTYGPTEATVVTTAARIRPGQPILIGQPLAGWLVAVVDPQGEPVEPGEPGELIIGGIGLGRYLDPHLDRVRFTTLPARNWSRAYPSGDIVRETPDGLAFVGRMDTQVKIGGRRVELGEIDAQLRNLPGATGAATLVRTTASGNQVLVGYVSGEVDRTQARDLLAARLPAALVPVLVILESLPATTAGKVDRAALPWPIPPRLDPSDPPPSADFGVTARRLAELWTSQLGPHPLELGSDFFDLGGTSIAAAKLVTVLRQRYPTVAVADVYRHRQLGQFVAHLAQLTPPPPPPPPPPVAEVAGSSGWNAVQLLGVVVLAALRSPAWIIGLLAFGNLAPATGLPRASWWCLVVASLVFLTPVGRATLLVTARRVFLADLAPGRYPRRGSLSCRLWFVERLSTVYRLNNLASTPWAAGYARWSGSQIGDEVRLGSLPSPTSLVTVGDGATVEHSVDLHGWWMHGSELVIGAIKVGAGARIGARSVLMPGASVGVGAEIEPGAVVSTAVPAGERWAGSPARHVGVAGEAWPAEPPQQRPRRNRWRLMYALGLSAQSSLTFIGLVVGLLVTTTWTPPGGDLLVRSALLAPVLAVAFFVTEALVVVVLFRVASLLLRPGWHSDEGGVAWSLWFTQSLLERSLPLLFPLYSSVFTRSYLRLLGVEVGVRTEMSHAVTINKMVSVGATSFGADDVAYLMSRRRAGWLHVSPIVVGDGAFLGNGAVLTDDTRVGGGSLVGVLTSPPLNVPRNTSWFGAPALELPRVAELADAAGTTSPPRIMVWSRGAVELVRIFGPTTVSVVLGDLILIVLRELGTRFGLPAMLALAPAVMLLAGLAAVLVTVSAKWVLIGRYRSGQHPLWSTFVWRDEIINSCQEQLAAVWLLSVILATPLMSWYLRAMGATIGADVWFDTHNITEFDVVTIGAGAAVNRTVLIETHLFQDRIMKIGPTSLGAGSTLGPSSAVLPDTALGANAVLGARSVVLRGEELPANSSWHGAPVTAI